MTNIESLLAELAELDVAFYCRHESPHGEAKVSLSPSELLRYRLDPTDFLAQHYGVSKSDYLSWHRSGYAVTCSAATKAGKPCRNIVDSGSAVTPQGWVDLQGQFCRAHS